MDTKTNNTTYDAHSLASIKPFIGVTNDPKEITFRSVLLGVILCVVMCISSTIMGLKIAHTISASIPVTFMSLLILRKFKGSHVLENNIVQTIASAGETVAGSLVFTLPALILIGYWTSFDYRQTAIIGIIGGILGVLFSIPLRKGMLGQENLPFPESTAVSEIIKAGETNTQKNKILLKGGFLATILSFMQSGLKIASTELTYCSSMGKFHFSCLLNLSLDMLAAGYIVGMRSVLPIILGGTFTWFIGIPIYVSLFGLPEAESLKASFTIIQKTYFRYIGLGVLIASGSFYFLSLIPKIYKAIYNSLNVQNRDNQTRTAKDIPVHYILWSILVLSAVILIVYFSFLSKLKMDISLTVLLCILLASVMITLVIGLACASVSAYFVGLIGTTCMPVSGIAIVSLFLFSSILMTVLKCYIDFSSTNALEISALIIVFSAIVSITSLTSAENMQNLKVGQSLGATPWKQQMMLIVGSIVAALTIPIILQLAFQVYGIGEVLPRPDMEPHLALSAPQANLIATLTQGFIANTLQLTPIFIGMIIGLVIILIEFYLKKRNISLKTPGLLFALGIYVPFSDIIGTFTGAAIRTVAMKIQKNQTQSSKDSPSGKGILFASGILAADAIVNSILIVLFAYYGSTDVFTIHWLPLKPFHDIISVGFYFCLCVLLYRHSVKVKSKAPMVAENY